MAKKIAPTQDEMKLELASLEKRVVSLRKKLGVVILAENDPARFIGQTLHTVVINNNRPSLKSVKIDKAIITKHKKSPCIVVRDDHDGLGVRIVRVRFSVNSKNPRSVQWHDTSPTEEIAVKSSLEYYSEDLDSLKINVEESKQRLEEAVDEYREAQDLADDLRAMLTDTSSL